MTPELQIRQPSSPEDWAAVRRICCLTGNGGDPIPPERWPFFAEQWVGPYQRLRPTWTYIATEERNGSPGSACAGYLTGCPDTRKFQFEFQMKLVPELLFRILGRREFVANPDTRRFLRRALFLEKSPERSFPREIRRRILSDYPAHLHINLPPEFRGAGLGGKLIDRYREDLRSIGVPGVHLFCGEGPMKFYLRQGFHELGRIEFRPGLWVFAMGKSA